jgi:hypothetical protein
MRIALSLFVCSLIQGKILAKAIVYMSLMKPVR